MTSNTFSYIAGLTCSVGPAKDGVCMDVECGRKELWCLPRVGSGCPKPTSFEPSGPLWVKVSQDGETSDCKWGAQKMCKITHGKCPLNMT